MSVNEHDLRKLVAGLRTDDEPNPAHRERLRRQMLETYERAGVRSALCVVRHASRDAEGKTHSALRLALAAAILLAATAAVWVWFGPAAGPTDLDRVLAATESVPWLHAVAKRYSNGEALTEQHWYNFAAKEAYTRTEDGAVTAYDYGAEQIRLDYRPRLKTPTLIVSELPRIGPFGAESAYDFVQSFASFAAKDNVEVEESTAQYEGRAVRTYGIETADAGTGPDGKGFAGLRMTVMADPQTKRIVAANVERLGRAGSVQVREEWVMSYPSSGPASVYDLGVPATAQVLDMRQGYRGTPGDMPATFVPTPSPSGSFRLEPLKIELPRRMFPGTPVDARTPNQEKPRTGPRPAFLAPAGTTNIARSKPVSSSDREPIAGSLDLITDGDKEALDGSFVELGPRPQHVTIDLQEPCEIYAVIIWHQHRWPRIYHDVVVQVSNDPAFRTGVRTIFNNDADDSLGLGAGRDLHYTETHEGKLIDGKSTPGRYVRCYSNGNTHDELNHYLEIEIYGRPMKSIKGN